MTTYSDTLDTNYTNNVVNNLALRRDFNPGTSYEGFAVENSIWAETISGGHPIVPVAQSRQASYDQKKREKANSEADRDRNKEISVITSLWKRIDRLRTYGVDWIDEDIEVGPTEEVIKKVRSLIPKLIYNDLIPFRITPSIDEGVCLAFQKERILTYIEFYNEGDIGMIAEDYINKKILENVDLKETNIIPALSKIIK